MPCYTIREAKELWDYAKKKYLSQPNRYGYPDFKELTNKLSDDIYRKTGVRVVPEEVAKMLATPKAVKARTKNLLLADRNRQQMLRQARDFVAGQEKTLLSRIFRGVYQAPYSAKVGFHSVALHMTHAWPYAFDPVMWKAFGKTWVHSMKALSESQARSIGQRIMLDPRFDEKVTSGLAVDPRKIYDDVNHRAGFFGKLGRMLGNSFLGLKELRSMGWDAIMDSAPEHLKTDELRKRASINVNHMTGAPGPFASRALSGKSGEALRAISFAPSLDVARVMRPVDLGQSVETLLRHSLNKAPLVGDALRKLWGDASPEARYLAGYNTRQWIRIAMVGSSMLMLNQLLLKHFFGSDEDINLGDFDKPDWASLKTPDGTIINPTGGETSLIRTLVRMGMHPKQAPTIFGNYALGKVHPFINFVGTLMKGYGFGGTDVPAPFGNAPNDFAHWAEFVGAELGPIFTEEGIHKFAKEMTDQTGVPESFNEKVLRSFGKAVLISIPIFLGMHAYKPEFEPKGSRGKGNVPFTQDKIMDHFNELLVIPPVTIYEFSCGRYIWFRSDLDICNDGTGPDYDDPYHQSENAYYNGGKFLNADKDKYIVIPPQIRSMVPGVVMGCQGRATNLLTGAQSLGVIGEIGPDDKTGETAYCLAQILNPKTTHNSGDTNRVYLYELWPDVPAVVDGKTYKLEPV